MKLKYIELKGFKSFAKKEKLDFSKQITAIVGPNGSGKSNIAEGFRFVLGEQSMKSLRSKRTEDLLFNGSSSMQRVNRAGVSLVFDNSTKEIKEAFDEIRIERIIHRDATNEYYINDSRARLKDITEMLAEAKIGSAGHHIISQGEADKMLAMSARERREYLEEALGLTQYQNKRNDALKKLEKTRENLVSIKSLIRELSPHVRYLEKEMKLIERKKELSLELESSTRQYIELCVPYYGKELTQKNDSLIEIESKIAILKKERREGECVDQRDEFSDDRKRLEREIALVAEEWDLLRREKGESERLAGRLEAKIELSDKGSHLSDREVPIPDAQERLTKIWNVLSPVRLELDVTVVHRAIEEALLLTRNSTKNLSTEERGENSLLGLQSELDELKKSILEKIQRENDLIERKQELEKAYSDTFQKEERDRSEAEKERLELQSLEMQRGTLEREIQALVQDKEYFYASLKEVILLTGASFSPDVERASQIHQDQIDRSALKASEHNVERLKLKIEGMQVGNTKEVESEYSSAKDRERFLETEVKDLELTVGKLVAISDSLRIKIEEEFKLGIKEISGFFSTFFSQMFKGGSAGLSVVRLKGKDDGEEEVFDEYGVEVVITMTHKKLRSIAMLSGGEKTLVSIALIFALSQVNPPPFLILDETDAALDEANSKRYGDALKELSRYSQLILITHNRETMSRAGMLYGVTMGNSSTSEILSVDLEEAEKIVR